MPICYPAILELRATAEIQWSARDSIFYALSTGACEDPLDAQERRFVTEPDLQALPSMATILAMRATVLQQSGIDQTMVVHGEQSIRLFAPLPASGAALAEARFTQLQDKGPEKGAVLFEETILKDPTSNAPLAQLNAAYFARGDGGFAGPNEPAAPAHAMPARKPDLSLDLPTRPNQALLYRLNGDYNPLHSDPDFARAAGFPRPILHGLCTYAITCRAVLQAFCAYDPTRLVAHSVRYSAPVFPGETITIDFWQDGSEISFEARIAARNATIIKNGRSEIM